MLRELDFVAYPDDGPNEVEVGRRLHLWSRDGRVTAAEAEAVNESFDAVMVATRFDLAVEIRRWFRGTVCFRYLGNVPTIPGATSAPSRRRDAEGIVSVPIFSTLADSPLGRAFRDQFLVRTVVPDPPVQVTRASGDAVGIYLAGLVPDDDWVAWTTRIAQKTDREVLAFGVPEDLHGAVSS
ncbi:MAG TPA: hypothetical protein VMY34_04175, partial [Acidimicrobiales bacterium]|nr:hypothetical protein [Acidimicrobiales bacterium]